MIGRLFLIISYFFCWVYFKILNSTEIKGLGDYRGGVLFYANHRTLADGFLIAYALGIKNRFRVPGKETFFPGPLMKAVARIWGVYLIRSRGRPKRADVAVFKNLAAALNRGENVLIFPEGKRCRRLEKFRPGILKLASAKEHLPLIPIRIEAEPPVIFKKIKIVFGPALPAARLKNLKRKDALSHLRNQLFAVKF